MKKSWLLLTFLLVMPQQQKTQDHPIGLFFGATLAIAGIIVGMIYLSPYISEYCPNCCAQVEKDPKGNFIGGARVLCGHVFHTACYNPYYPCRGCEEIRLARTEAAARTIEDNNRRAERDAQENLAYERQKRADAEYQAQIERQRRLDLEAQNRAQTKREAKARRAEAQAEEQANIAQAQRESIESENRRKERVRKEQEQAEQQRQRDLEQKRQLEIAKKQEQANIERAQRESIADERNRQLRAQEEQRREDQLALEERQRRDAAAGRPAPVPSAPAFEDNKNEQANREIQAQQQQQDKGAKCPRCGYSTIHRDGKVMERFKLPCGHYFHKGCLEIFLKEGNAACSVCFINGLPRAFSLQDIKNILTGRLVY